MLLASPLMIQLQVQQLLLSPQEAADDAAGGGLYCVLSTAPGVRFTASRAGSSEAFLLTPWELEHAERKPLPAAAPSAAAAPAAAAAGSQAPPAQSPVLTLELKSRQRWGSDALVAAGELLLAPFLGALQPDSGLGTDVKVPLARKGAQKTSSKAGGAAGGDAATGADLAVVLQLTAYAAPAAPEQLLGPIGSGTAAVPPRHAADASWVPLAQPVLHTSGGHFYQAPGVQLLRVTLQKAAGLHNLHVDPQAAAAAAAAMSRLAGAAGGGGASKASFTADRARAAAERAMLGARTAAVGACVCVFGGGVRACVCW
jgi:hypothetical protein